MRVAPVSLGVIEHGDVGRANALLTLRLDMMMQ